MKFKGYFLIDNLFSIVLILIISMCFIPNITNLIKGNKKVYENINSIKNAQNTMEKIIGKSYQGDGVLDKNFLEEKNIVEFKDISDDLVEISIFTKEDDDEIKLQCIIKKGGLYSN